jgi:hypothetical protein
VLALRLTGFDPKRTVSISRAIRITSFAAALGGVLPAVDDPWGAFIRVDGVVHHAALVLVGFTQPELIAC